MYTTPAPPPPSLRLYLTDQHERLWETADRFAADRIARRVDTMERSVRVEKRLVALMAEQGWYGVIIPAEYGGTEAGHVAKTVLVHRTARVSAAVAAALQATVIPAYGLTVFADDEQKRTWLPGIADGSALWSIAVTERWAGGHIGGMETTAEPAPDGGWFITGTKTRVGNAHLARWHLVVARTGAPGETASRALTAFAIDADSPGLVLHPHHPALGLRGFSLGEIDLDRVHVPAEHVIGEVGRGMDVAQTASITAGRLNIGAISLGLHEAMLETTTGYLSSRPRYNGSLTDLPVVRDQLGEMQARFHTARTLVYHASALLDLPPHPGEQDPAPVPDTVASDVRTRWTADLVTAKYVSQQLVEASGQDAAHLHGSRAYDLDHPFQRLWRDAQMLYSPAGTGETQRIRLADTLLGTPT
ncbi:acyl-CoA dehydrogenase family protein [Streptomyces acidiscabies]|uniref:Acyl-CoA dehydrogenase n=1 Tax=Streptomyces acidiscabies TaxID=42234 RepID=A0AAP6BJX3_9ACTN|nr:acyl-CoA dehydrogenase [Streptomyces acidiscabies]MBP5936752.1 acyl-CoA dehydrogenase [Streptomyces sp. LBUM 1476]MBZ3915241.1 acyl-CoA dehydrogenase [Streptomyces acidiscabies]MDX2966068.1 acyl-CoA dehydrogenase [Streptomyces acidiscabies]MDX3021303.1 acyl-CoA dehydrogenase [Streptomyces acidiscabies]MDX3793444.1 acyl-CoA dehydrogenase [Streptomyces acidiscabies]